jgi:GAF domain-containing protein
MKPGAVTFILDAEDANLDQDAREAFRAIGARAMLSVPLRAGIRESNLGWLVVVNTAPDSFKLDQERILQQLGDMASTALENRLLLQRQQETVREVLTLYEATNAVSHAHDLTQISDVLQVALGNMNPDYVAGYLAGDTEDEDVELFNFAEEGSAAG